ncbi:MAG: hypothetical protein AB7H80_17355 [Candidatus Kapaibacterium sp.]
MKRFLLLLFAFIPLFFSPSISFAQLKDVFGVILQEVSGGNVSIRYDLAPKDIKDQEGILWLDASLKYGPFGFGEKHESKIVKKHTAQKSSTTVVIDTTITKDGKIVSKHTKTVQLNDSDCMDSIYRCMPELTLEEYTIKEKTQNLTLAFGVTHAPRIDLSNDDLSLRTSATSFYIRGIINSKPFNIESDFWKWVNNVGFSFGGGVHYLTLSGAEVRRRTDNIGVARMLSESTFSLQGFLGVTLDVSDFALFMNGGYDASYFSDLKFDDIPQDGVERDTYVENLRRGVDLSGLFVRLGLSLSFKKT